MCTKYGRIYVICCQDDLRRSILPYMLSYTALHRMKTKPSCLDLPKEYEPVGEA
eukprot:COSAG06_NODE_9972_length_1778_cov_1.712329_1_plen_53_part_10